MSQQDFTTLEAIGGGRTENDAIIEAIRQETLVTASELGNNLREVFRPAGVVRDLVDLQMFAPTPRRVAGTVVVHTAAGFIASVAQRRDAVPPVVYADESASQLVAVLNDDHGPVPGWKDHRVQLQLRSTPEWLHWKNHTGLRSQEAFAEVIEEGLPEITQPDPATMLELAQTFHATTNARFKTGAEVKTGRRQLVYEEDLDASAGSLPGSIIIPDEFVITVRPFIGSDPWQVRCRLRFRLPRAGDFTIGYELIRPADVERYAFAQVVETVTERIDEPLVLIEGLAPPVGM